MAVTSVPRTRSGTHYAAFGISAGSRSALVIASGVAQAVAIAAKPLPNHDKGGAPAPAECAHPALNWAGRHLTPVGSAARWRGALAGRLGYVAGTNSNAPIGGLI